MSVPRVQIEGWLQRERERERIRKRGEKRRREEGRRRETSITNQHFKGNCFRFHDLIICPIKCKCFTSDIIFKLNEITGNYVCHLFPHTIKWNGGQAWICNQLIWKQEGWPVSDTLVWPVALDKLLSRWPVKWKCWFLLRAVGEHLFPACLLALEQPPAGWWDEQRGPGLIKVSGRGQSLLSRPALHRRSFGMVTGPKYKCSKYQGKQGSIYPDRDRQSEE